MKAWGQVAAGSHCATMARTNAQNYSQREGRAAESSGPPEAGAFPIHRQSDRRHVVKLSKISLSSSSCPYSHIINQTQEENLRKFHKPPGSAAQESTCPEPQAQQAQEVQRPWRSSSHRRHAAVETHRQARSTAWIAYTSGSAVGWAGQEVTLYWLLRWRKEAITQGMSGKRLETRKALDTQKEMWPCPHPDFSQ